ncbi:MAG: FHA domain-containing protein [Deltaproteobacteria bacterium]|nr:FHA domain-containing protein [Deltaproteobacteria bacterium]
MPMIHIFSSHCPTIETVALDKLPQTFFAADPGILEIDFKKNEYLSTGNKEFLLNNNKILSGVIKHNDLMIINDQFVIFNQYNKNISDNFYLGRFNQQGDVCFLFHLPAKINSNCFETIDSIIKNCRGRRKLYLACESVRYMDSATLSAMLHLIKITEKEQCTVHFYRISDKFNSYLKLANIKNRCRQIEKKDPLLEFFLKKNRAQHNYLIVNEEHCLTINPKKALLTGRTKKLCELHFQNPSISRLHAALIQIEDEILIIDCGSKNHTYINEQAIPAYQAYPLNVQDRISFANQPPFSLQQQEIAL